MKIRRYCSIWIAATGFGLCAITALAQSNVVVRVVGANISSGNNQSYLTPGLDIFKGLKPNISPIQEFNSASTTTNGFDPPAGIREMIDNPFGTSFFYFREPYNT